MTRGAFDREGTTKGAPYEVLCDGRDEEQRSGGAEELCGFCAPRALGRRWR